MTENGLKDNSGQYLLQEKIAQGGMSEIYKGLAEDSHGIKKTVVIKKILPHIAANKEFVDMLVSEAKIAVHLSHGNIAQIYDLGCSRGDYFMVMEYVDGKSLSRIHKKCLKEGRLIPFEYSCYFISEVANGLDYMHNKTDPAGNSLGIVHRDISPQNIIVSYSGTVKIIDFGIAKAAFKLDETEAGILKGKFAYMSPEQARGDAIDGRSDIFSLGIILHELLCGRRLFKEKDNKATIRNVRRAEINPPSFYNGDVPKELDEIAMKALAKEPERRYQHARELTGDIQKFVHQAYPDFQLSSVSEFVARLFADEEKDEDQEKEHTPLLIISQKDSAIQPEISEAPKPPEPPQQPKKPWRPDLGGIFRRLWPFFCAAALLVGIFALVFAGLKLGWWKTWTGFFRPVILSEKENAKSAAKKFTTLVVESRPAGAKIFVDDMETAFRTPATISDIKADGKIHTVGIFMEGRKFFGAPFTAAPDETVRFNPALEAAVGSLLIVSEPAGADVTINGEPAGTTPLEKKELPHGTVLKIHIEKKGYTSFDENVKIVQDKEITLRPNLLRQKKN